jgi:hypothetical protein
MFSVKIILNNIHPPWSTNHREENWYGKYNFSKAFNFQDLIYYNSVLFKSMLNIERRRHTRLAE